VSRGEPETLSRMDFWKQENTHSLLLSKISQKIAHQVLDEAA
jgi:hypothetical protein